MTDRNKNNTYKLKDNDNFNKDWSDGSTKDEQ